MLRAIGKYSRDFTAIIVLFLIAMLVGGYILHNQRLRFPFVQAKTFTLKAELSTAQAVTPGQGQTVRVSGVRIGDLSKVELVNGRAIVTMAIDPKYKDLVHTDASALLRPKTGLKDMFLELDPGSDSAPVAKENWTLPIENTLPDVNPDEVFAALDTDTRDYLKLLIADAGRGLKGRGGDLQDIFARFEPVHRDLAKINKGIATRRKNLRRLINSLNGINGALASRDKDLSRLVDSSAAVFRAFASQQANITRSVHNLPSALKETTGALSNVDDLATILKPAADDLRPAVRSLNEANPTLTKVAKQLTPVVKNDLRPFVTAAAPVVRDLKPGAKNLASATPDLTKSFVALNHLFNTLSYNPDGREDPSKSTRQEGYLFWLGWLSHQAVQLFSTSDAHGVFRPLTLGATCTTFQQIAKEQPEAAFLYNLTPLLTGAGVCAPGSGGAALRAKAKAATDAYTAKIAAKAAKDAKGGDR